MIRVLYVLDTLKKRYGVTSVALNYFNCIKSEEVCIDFLCYPDSEMDVINEIRQKGSNVYYMPKLSILGIRKFVVFLNRFFEQNKDISIVHSHFCQIDSLVFPIAKKYGVMVCMSHSHSTSFSSNKLKSVRNFIMCLPLKRFSDVWAACSVKAGIFLYGDKFGKSNKSLIIHNGINCSKFKYNKELRSEVRKELGYSNEIVIGHVGSFNPIKNHNFIIELFKALHDKSNGNYRLLLVGDGELKGSIVRKINEKGLNDFVIFTGVRNDVNKLLQAIDIFILPSYSEGLPVVGIEAQAAGLPCLFSDSITREVDICNTSFLSIYDIEKWIDEIYKLKDFKRQDCHNIVADHGYDMKVCADKLVDFYLSIIRGAQ